MGVVRGLSVSTKGKVGQASCQKHKHEPGRATGDNEEPKGIKREACFSLVPPCPLCASSSFAGWQ